MNNLSNTLLQIVAVVVALHMGYEVVWQVPDSLSGVAHAVLATGAALGTLSAWLG